MTESGNCSQPGREWREPCYAIHKENEGIYDETEGKEEDGDADGIGRSKIIYEVMQRE